MSCPKCKSNEWKSASLVYRDGLSASASIGLGIGLSEDGDIDLDVGGLKGKNQTVLSKLAAPPLRRPSQVDGIKTSAKVAMCSIVSFAVSVYFFGDLNSDEYPITNGFMILNLIVISISCLMAVYVPAFDPDVEEEHRLALIKYSKKKMCLRCGNFYIN
jgi:hypothetical protein